MVKELNAETFKELISSDKPVIVDFWASWCGPCKMLAPIFEEISQDYTNKLNFAKISTEEFPEIAQDNNIRGIPCLVVFKQGKEVDRIVGYHQKPALKEKIEEILNKV